MMKTKFNILILGGTGAIGNHLVEILKTTENIVYVTSRKNRENEGNIQYLKGNAHDVFFINNILNTKKFDVIVDFMYYSNSEFAEKTSLYLKNVRQYICLSSCRVYANSKNAISEESPKLIDIIKNEEYLKGSDYSIEKCRLEDILQSSDYYNWTIVRPYITYSERRLQLGIYELSDWYYRVCHRRSIQISKNIAESYTTLTYGYDVALGIFSLIGKDSALGNDYNITCSRPIKWKHVLEIYADEIFKSKGIDVKYKVTDKDIFSSIGIDDAQVKYDRIYNRVFDNQKISLMCDTNLFLNAEDGLRNCIRVFLQQYSDMYIKNIKIDWWRQVLMDRLTGEIAQKEEFECEKDYFNYLQILNDNHLLIRNKLYKFKKKIKKIIFS